MNTRTRRATLSLAATALALLAPGCGRRSDLSPPVIAYGQQECDLCRMIISEERFAAALVLSSGARVEKLAFDDVGCVLSYLRDRRPPDGWTAYVHDLESRQWVDASAATFVVSPHLHTPMASELAAAATRAGAERIAEQYPGQLVTFGTLMERLVRTPAASSTPTSEDSIP